MTSFKISDDIQIQEEEIDFMSDEILQQCTKNDVRPSLLYKHTEKRIHEKMKRKEKQLGIRQMEEIQRTSAMNKELGTDNKGFKLLQKMGYKPGVGIGKKTTGSCSAQIEQMILLQQPIPIEIKRNRECLGKKSIIQEKRQKLEELGDVNSFRARLQATAVDTFTKSDLRKAQRVCQTLDEKEGLRVSPFEPWYWSDVESTLKTEEANECCNDTVEDNTLLNSLLQPQTQLAEVVNYLRTRYFYCIWCGTAFDSDEDLEQSCPGITREDH